MNHQAPLEPEVSLAYVNKEGELVVIGRSIQIHGHRMQLREALGIRQSPIPGAVRRRAVRHQSHHQFRRHRGSGGALLQEAGPIVPNIDESMWLSSKRHPFEMKLNLAADAKGKLTACQNDMTVNKGAYMLLGPIPISRALQMFSGPYNIPNVLSMNKLVYTNNGAGGAARRRTAAGKLRSRVSYGHDGREN